MNTEVFYLKEEIGRLEGWKVGRGILVCYYGRMGSRLPSILPFFHFSILFSCFEFQFCSTSCLTIERRFGVVKMASDVMFAPVNRVQYGWNRFAAVHDFRTTLGESAAVVIVGGFRDSTGNRVQLCPAFIASRCRFQEFDCVGVLRGLVKLLPCPHLRNLSGVHYSDTVSDVRDNSQIVCNQQHRHLQFLLEALDELKYLCLYRNVQCGCRFVSDEKSRTAGESHRNHDALFHTAGHLVRVFIVTRRGFRDTDKVEHLDCSVPCGGAAEVLMLSDRLRNLATDGENGIEAGHRLLEHHSDVVALNLPFLDLRQTCDVLSVVVDGTPCDEPCGLRDKLDHGERGDAFTASRFTDERENLVRRNLERDAVNGTGKSVWGPKIGFEVLYAKQRFLHGITIAQNFVEVKRNF